MKALLLIAHGSRRAASNEEVMKLAEHTETELEETFTITECAFLELATPDIPNGIARCVERGATTITVVPYFLAAGTHVVNDIPMLMDDARAQHPEVNIVVAKHIGGSALMPSLIRQAAEVA